MRGLIDAAASMDVEVATGREAAEELSSFRRSVCAERGVKLPEKFLIADALAAEADHYFARSHGVTVAVARTVSAQPLRDVSATTIDPDWIDTITSLQTRGRLGSISRLLATATGTASSGATLAIYKAILHRNFHTKTHFITESRTSLARRLGFLGIETAVVGTGSRLPSFAVEPVLLDVHGSVKTTLRGPADIRDFWLVSGASDLRNAQLIDEPALPETPAVCDIEIDLRDSALVRQRMSS